MVDLVTRTKILIVEDHSVVARSLELFLTQLGYRCVTTDSAERAMSLDLQLFDLALIDITLPGLSGTELADQIRSKRPGFHIILMTANLHDLDRTAIGPYKLLSKPFRPNQIADAIAQTLNHRPLFETRTVVQLR